MAVYNYSTITSSLVEKNGKIEASSLSEAFNLLKNQGYYVTFLKESQKKWPLLPFLKKSPDLNAMERIIFTDHLSAMVKAGTPLIEALTSYMELDDKSKNNEIIDRIIKEVEEGKNLSDALKIYPKTFSPLYTALISASEKSGNLDEILEYITGFLRREYEFNGKVKTALMYPALVLTVAFVVITLLVLLVIPRITALTKSLGGEMPLATRIVSGVAEFLSHYGFIVILFPVLLVVGLSLLLKNQQMKRKIDPYLLKIPLIGGLLKKYILARFMRIVGSCLHNGIPLSLSFAMVADVVNNSLYKKACRRIENKIVKGEELARAISSEGKELFPSVIVRMVKGAEKTGTVDQSLLRLSTFYEAEVDRDLKRITILIEPTLVVFLGLIVAAIAISVIAPIYQMTSKIK